MESGFASGADRLIKRGTLCSIPVLYIRDRFEVLHRNMILRSRLYVILGNDTVAGKCDGHNFTGCYGSERAPGPCGAGARRVKAHSA